MSMILNILFLFLSAMYLLQVNFKKITVNNIIAFILMAVWLISIIILYAIK